MSRLFWLLTTLDGWDYLITGGPYSAGSRKAGFSWVAFWCRLKTHPCGVIYYNPSGFEPDMHCQDCGDEL